MINERGLRGWPIAYTLPSRASQPEGSPGRPGIKPTHVFSPPPSPRAHPSGPQCLTPLSKNPRPFPHPQIPQLPVLSQNFLMGSRTLPHLSSALGILASYTPSSLFLSSDLHPLPLFPPNPPEKTRPPWFAILYLRPPSPLPLPPLSLTLGVVSRCYLHLLAA